MVMTATNVSRIAHSPSAAVHGSFYAVHGQNVCKNEGEETVNTCLDNKNSSYNCHSRDKDVATEEADKGQLLRLLERSSKKDGDG